MPKQVCRVGDQNAAGGIILTGDNSVLINGRPVAVLSSPVTPHPCCGAMGCPPIHCAATTNTNKYDILVNGKPVIVVGDNDTCGHTRISGSTDVLVGS